MRKITVLAFMLIFAGLYQANAQMGIGTAKPSNASMLDVKAEDKGILIPRLELIATDDFAPIIGDQEDSILVYNLATSEDLDKENAVSPGFYYWKANKWHRIINEVDLNTAITNLDNVINQEIIKNLEEISKLLNYIVPSNPDNFDENGKPIVDVDHSTVVWDGDNFFVVEHNGTEYTKTIINVNELVAGLETNTFIKVVEEAGKPDVYYYFSEAVIKAWLDADEENKNPETNMPVDFAGVIKIDVVGDVVQNFEHILNQEITYGDSNTTITIEELIKNISKDVEGNVVYEQNDNSEWVFKYYNSITGEYEEINLTELVANVETKTKITRAVITVEGDTPNYIDTEEPKDTKTGEIYYKYDSEDGTDYLNITEDILHALENNESIKNEINNILQNEGGVFFGDIVINGDTYTDILYYYDSNGNPVVLDLSTTLIENLINNKENTLILKEILGDHIVGGDSSTAIYTGDTINGLPVIAYHGTTQIGDNSAETSGVEVILPTDATATALEGVVSISLYQNGVLVTSTVNDVAITGTKVDFNIGVGAFYQVLPAGTYEVVVYATINE